MQTEQRATTGQVMADTKQAIAVKWERIVKNNQWEKVRDKYPFGYSQFEATEWCAIVSHMHATTRKEFNHAVMSLGIFDSRMKTL